jgi:hypothetical protein
MFYFDGAAKRGPFLAGQSAGRISIALHAPEPHPEDSIGGRQLQAFQSRPTQNSEWLPKDEVLQPELSRGWAQRSKGARHDAQASPHRGEE